MITAIDKNTALILIDLQKGIVSNKTAVPASVILANAAKLTEAFRRADLPIVIVHVEPAGKWTKIRKEVQQPGGNPSPDFAEIAPEIITRQGDIFITKHTWGAFFETPLDAELQKRNVTNIVLAGISTSIGVETTARQAAERGYNISFAQDAMTDTAADAHANSIKYIFPRIGETGTTEEIIQMLEKRSSDN